MKDRPAARMLGAGLASGELAAGKTILDASSGNTGIAYAWMGARLGHRVKLAVPATINRERRAVLEAYGAELVLTDGREGSDGAIRKAKELFSRQPAAYFFPDQYNNPENWKAHYETTGPEILGDTSGAVTHFVAGLGTSGTFRGTGSRLKEAKGVRLISIQPDSPFHGIEGLKHMASAIVPGIYDPSQADEELFISTEDAQRAAVAAAKEQGLLIGVSGGANLAGAFILARRLSELGETGVIVTILPDSGERYLGERFWTELE